MTITLKPDQERAIRDAIRAGQIASVEELIQRAIAALPRRSETPAAGGSVFEQGLGLFGSPEDAALLDEVVSIAYKERHRSARKSQASDLTIKRFEYRHSFLKYLDSRSSPVPPWGRGVIMQPTPRSSGV